MPTVRWAYDASTNTWPAAEAVVVTPPVEPQSSTVQATVTETV